MAAPGSGGTATASAALSAAAHRARAAVFTVMGTETRGGTYGNGGGGEWPGGGIYGKGAGRSSGLPVQPEVRVVR